MSDKEMIQQLVDSLDEMMEWARNVSDEFIDGGDLRKEYAASLKDARTVLNNALASLK